MSSSSWLSWRDKKRHRIRRTALRHAFGAPARPPRLTGAAPVPLPAPDDGASAPAAAAGPVLLEAPSLPAAAASAALTGGRPNTFAGAGPKRRLGGGAGGDVPSGAGVPAAIASAALAPVGVTGAHPAVGVVA